MCIYIWTGLSVIDAHNIKGEADIYQLGRLPIAGRFRQANLKRKLHLLKHGRPQVDSQCSALFSPVGLVLVEENDRVVL
jgi:hypothetical protein